MRQINNKNSNVRSYRLIVIVVVMGVLNNALGVVGASDIIVVNVIAFDCASVVCCCYNSCVKKLIIIIRSTLNFLFRLCFH